MTDDLAEFHDELRATARDLLTKNGGTPAGVGAEADGAPPAVDWSMLAELGWLGLEVPEALDGAEATFAELAVILEEMGRAVASGPFLGAVVLGVGALNLVETGAARDDLLREIASGTTRIAVACSDADGATIPGTTPFRVEGTAAGARVTGQAAFVPDAPGAERLLLLGTEADGRVVVVAADAGAVDVAAQPVLDATRRFGVVTADGVTVGDDALWHFAGDPDIAVARIFHRGALAVACDSLGLSETMLETTVAYAGVREQFGRAIGSFQAVKHACADMLVQISVARQLVSAGVDALVEDDPDAAIAVARAKAYATGSAVDVVGKAMQLHGGIGYTWESGVHAYLKRAGLNRSLFGSPLAHRRLLAGSLVAPYR